MEKKKSWGNGECQNRRKEVRKRGEMRGFSFLENLKKKKRTKRREKKIIINQKRKLPDGVMVNGKKGYDDAGWLAGRMVEKKEGGMEIKQADCS